MTGWGHCYYANNSVNKFYMQNQSKHRMMIVSARSKTADPINCQSSFPWFSINDPRRSVSVSPSVRQLDLRGNKDNYTYPNIKSSFKPVTKYTFKGRLNEYNEWMKIVQVSSPDSSLTTKLEQVFCARSAFTHNL